MEVLTSGMLFGVAVFALTFCFRRMMELAFPVLPAKSWWTGGVLILMPALIGMLLVLVLEIPVGAGLAKETGGFPYPSDLTTFRSHLLFYGIPMGFLAGTTYRIVKKVIFDKYGVTLPDDQ